MEITEKMIELQREIEAFFLEKERLSTENIFLKKLVGELESKFETIHEAINRCACIGLTDLDNKIKEAEYNALNFFEKKCPYCGNGVFDGHIRNKINVDHFWPIAKGGQHVPWNILPVCGRCNKKKKDNLPSDFLGTDKYIVCLDYLASVRNKYGNETQTCVETIAQIKGSILSDATLPPHEAVKRLYNIFGLSFDDSDIFGKQGVNERILAEFIEKYCVVDEKEEVRFSELYIGFEKWWLNNRSNKPPLKKKTSQILSKRFTRNNRGGNIYFSGLNLRPPSEENKGEQPLDMGQNGKT